MATVETVLEETGSRTLEALCDTFIPAVAQEGSDEVEQQFMARAASALSVPLEIERLMTQTMTPEEQAQVSELLAGLERAGLLELDLAGRTSLVQEIAAGDPAARQGLQALKGLTMLFFYGLPDAAGGNPNWEALGFPGPKAPPPSAEQAPKTIGIKEVSGETARLSCDVCVVGSGAGGSVIAARVRRRRARTCWCWRWARTATRRTSPTSRCRATSISTTAAAWLTSESGSITILAGSTLGGGTVVNYMNCVRTPETILAEWEGRLDGCRLERDFIEEHMDVVMERIGANTEATRQNRTHQKMLTVRRAGLRAPADLAQRVAGRRPRVLRVLRAGLPARLQALGDEDVAAGRLRPRGRKRSWAATPSRILVARRPRDGRGGDGHPRRRLDHRADDRRADRDGGVRLDRVARSAAAQRHRRARGRQEPAAASRVRRVGRLRRADRGLERADPVGAVRPLLRHRGRLRLSDRGRRDAARRSSRPRCRGCPASSTSG